MITYDAENFMKTGVDEKEREIEFLCVDAQDSIYRSRIPTSIIILNLVPRVTMSNVTDIAIAECY